MKDVKQLIAEIEQFESDHIVIDWTPGAAKIFPAKKPVELYLNISNDPEGFLQKMDDSHRNELRSNFKWSAETLQIAIQRSQQLIKHYGCNDAVPKPFVDEKRAIYLTAQVIYRVSY